MSIKVPDGPSRTAARLYAFAKRCVRIDSRSLAAFRISFGALIVADALLRARNFHYFYTDQGVVPLSMALSRSGTDNPVTVFALTTNETAIAAIFVLYFLVGVQLMLGWKTRIATVLAFFLVISFDFRNPFVTSYADIIFRMLLFWGIFLPLGERWSLDAAHRVREARPHVENLASFAILAQLLVMYVVNGYHKYGNDKWMSGEATPLVLGMDEITWLLAPQMRELAPALMIGGLFWVYLLLFAWVLFFLRGWARAIYAGALMGGHASFMITVRIGAFPYATAGGLLLFIPGRVWDDLAGMLARAGVDRATLGAIQDRVAGVGRSVPNPRIDRGWFPEARQFAYDFVLVVMVVSLIVTGLGQGLHEAGHIDDEEWEHLEGIDEGLAMINMDMPNWSIFAPNPRTTDRYYVAAGQTESGEQVDVYNDREFTFERPAHHDLHWEMYDTYRERFFMNSVRRDGQRGSDGVDVTFGDHLCEEFNENHDDELRYINLYVVQEPVTMDTLDEPADRERYAYRLYEHGCGDNEPEQMSPPRLNLTDRDLASASED